MAMSEPSGECLGIAVGGNVSPERSSGNTLVNSDPIVFLSLSLGVGGATRDQGAPIDKVLFRAISKIRRTILSMMGSLLF